MFAPPDRFGGGVRNALLRYRMLRHCLNVPFEHGGPPFVSANPLLNVRHALVLLSIRRRMGLQRALHERRLIQEL